MCSKFNDNAGILIARSVLRALRLSRNCGWDHGSSPITTESVVKN